MYYALEAIGVKKGLNKRWGPIGLLDYTVAELYAQFRRVIITLQFSPNTTKLYLDTQTVAAQYASYPLRIQDMLTELSTTALTLLKTPPVIATRSAKFKDAYASRYTVTPVSPLYGTNVLMQDRTAALLTRTNPTTDYRYFKKRCMVSVNGFYHMIDTDNVSGVLVQDAMTTLRVSKQNQIGLYSFSDMCDIEYVPITLNMLHKRMTPDMLAGLREPEPYATSGFIKLNKDLTNKTVLLVLGGYLHVPESLLYSQVGDDEFKIDFANYPLFERLYESMQYIDLSALGLTSDIRNPSQFSVQQMLSDGVLMKYMTLSQSFFVILDTPEVFVNRQYIKKTGMPGMFISYKPPVYPIVVGNGRMPEYWSTHEDGQYSLTVYDNTVRQKAFNQANARKLNSISGADVSVDPELLGGAYFLELGCDLK
jgi:hypothetical protein